MKLHSDTITISTITAACRERGLRNVHVETVNVRGSKSRTRRIDFTLSGNSVHRMNYGTAMAATFDEWGIVLDELFQVDPHAIIGSYHGYEMFRWMTGYRFDDLISGQTPHRTHRWIPRGDCTSYCKCGASLHWDHDTLKAFREDLAKAYAASKRA